MGTSYRMPIVVAQLSYVGLTMVGESPLNDTVSALYLRSPWIIGGQTIDHFVSVVGLPNNRDSGQVDLHLSVAAGITSSQEAAFEAMILQVFTDFADVLEDFCEVFTMTVNISYLAKALCFYGNK